MISREKTLKLIYKTLIKLGPDENILRISLRKDRLIPTPPPGSNTIVTSREEFN